MFVRDTFWGWYIGRAVKGAKFGDANYEIAHALDDKPTSARIPVFHLGGQFTRNFINVYVAYFVYILWPGPKICRNVHDVAVLPFPPKYGVGADMYTNRSTTITIAT